MNVRQMPIEELELLSYTDIAYEILKEDKKPKTTPELFKEVCSLLNINEDQMMDMIGDFYTNLTTDKRFILLDDAKWDLKEFHAVKLVVDEEEDEEDDASDEEVVEETEDEAVEPDIDTFENEDDDDMEDLEDLVVVTEEEMDD